MIYVSPSKSRHISPLQVTNSVEGNSHLFCSALAMNFKLIRGKSQIGKHVRRPPWSEGGSENMETRKNFLIGDMHELL